MPTRASKPKMPRDTNQLAAQILRMATGEGEPEEKQDTRNQAAVALSKLGASKGGKARAAKMTKAERSKAASEAAKRRWSSK